MGLQKFFAKEIFIRLEDGDALVSTFKYGSFYSKTKEFDLNQEVPAVCEPATLEHVSRDRRALTASHGTANARSSSYRPGQEV